MNAIVKIITIVIAYLLGAVPFGLLIARSRLRRYEDVLS